MVGLRGLHSTVWSTGSAQVGPAAEQCVEHSAFWGLGHRRLCIFEKLIGNPLDPGRPKNPYARGWRIEGR